MRGRNVVALEERLLCHFPVRRYRQRLPPVMAHLADREVFQHLAHRRDVVVERRRIPVEVDENEPGEHDTVNLAQADIAVLQLAATELLKFQYELIVAVQVPARSEEHTT